MQQPGFRVQNITNVFLKTGEATVLTLTLNPETVAVGTRRSDRTALESAVPVDMVEMSELGSRTSVGAFPDEETDVTKRWSVSGALRYENYSTLGSAFVCKATENGAISGGARPFAAAFWAAR